MGQPGHHNQIKIIPPLNRLLCSASERLSHPCHLLPVSEAESPLDSVCACFLAVAVGGAIVAYCDQL